MDIQTLPKLLDGKKVAEIIGCSYVQSLRIMRKIGAIKINKLVRVDRDLFLKYLDNSKESAPIVAEKEKTAISWTLDLDNKRVIVE